jgi:hypothetical protein
MISTPHNGDKVLPVVDMLITFLELLTVLWLPGQAGIIYESLNITMKPSLK